MPKPRPVPPKPRTIKPDRAIDQTFLLAINGSRWSSLVLPSGDEIAAVEGSLWRVETIAEPTGGKIGTLVLEPRNGETT
jgi:hypothetical protein